MCNIPLWADWYKSRYIQKYLSEVETRSKVLQWDGQQLWLNTLRPRQNRRHFPDDIFKWIFLNENVWISIKISLKFVPKGLISNIPALIQLMAWRRPGNKPLSEPMMVSLPTHICVTRPQWVKINHFISFCCPYIWASMDVQQSRMWIGEELFYGRSHPRSQPRHQPDDTCNQVVTILLIWHQLCEYIIFHRDVYMLTDACILLFVSYISCNKFELHRNYCD